MLHATPLPCWLAIAMSHPCLHPRTRLHGAARGGARCEVARSDAPLRHPLQRQPRLGLHCTGHHNGCMATLAKGGRAAAAAGRRRRRRSLRRAGRSCSPTSSNSSSTCPRRSAHSAIRTRRERRRAGSGWVAGCERLRELCFTACTLRGGLSTKTSRDELKSAHRCQPHPLGEPQPKTGMGHPRCTLGALAHPLRHLVPAQQLAPSAPAPRLARRRRWPAVEPPHPPPAQLRCPPTVPGQLPVCRSSRSRRLLGRLAGGERCRPAREAVGLWRCPVSGRLTGRLHDAPVAERLAVSGATHGGVRARGRQPSCGAASDAATSRRPTAPPRSSARPAAQLPSLPGGAGQLQPGWQPLRGAQPGLCGEIMRWVLGGGG